MKAFTGLQRMFHRDVFIFPGGIPAVQGSHLEGRCPVEQVGEVKVLDVVAGDYVGVRGPDKLRPALMQAKEKEEEQKLL